MCVVCTYVVHTSLALLLLFHTIDRILFNSGMREKETRLTHSLLQLDHKTPNPIDVRIGRLEMKICVVTKGKSKTWNFVFKHTLKKK